MGAVSPTALAVAAERVGPFDVLPGGFIVRTLSSYEPSNADNDTHRARREYPGQQPDLWLPNGKSCDDAHEHAR
jgi:hypothetical protein